MYHGHRFPAEVISYAVWLYFRFPLSLRMVEEILAARGVCVSYETVRRWGEKFGKAFSDQFRRRAPARGDKWQMDEVVVSIAGEQHWLWRAVDQNSFVIDVLVQRRRDTRAAQRLMRKLLKSAVTPPRVMVTDKLRSYGAAKAKMGLYVEHRQHKGLNNRAENSHQPTRRRERIMEAFQISQTGATVSVGSRSGRESLSRSLSREGDRRASSRDPRARLRGLARRLQEFWRVLRRGKPYRRSSRTHRCLS
jgi:putative transposase